MLNKKSRYAIKALIEIARQDAAKTPVSVAHIAEQTNIPLKFLEAILHDLKVAGFVLSKKGSSGGYVLNKPAEEIHLAALIRVTNGPIAMVPCVSLNYYEPCEICENEHTCGIHVVMEQVRDASLAILNKTTIAELIRREDKLKKAKKPTQRKR
jgi:Rrf2 family protein